MFKIDTTYVAFSGLEFDEKDSAFTQEYKELADMVSDWCNCREDSGLSAVTKQAYQNMLSMQITTDTGSWTLLGYTDRFVDVETLKLFLGLPDELKDIVCKMEQLDRVQAIHTLSKYKVKEN